MASNNHRHAELLQAAKDSLPIQCQNTASHARPTPTGTPPINPISPAPDHSITAPTSQLPTNNPTNGNLTNGNLTNGNLTNGNSTNGNPANGNSTNGNPTNGNLINGNGDPISDQGGSWLFRLSPRIRQMIWRELLVKTKIYISFTNCRLLMAQRGAKRKQRATRQVSEFDEEHVEYYGVQGDDNTGEEADVGTYFSPRRCHEDWFEYAKRSMSRQLPNKFRDSYHPRPDLNIFLACHLTRQETEPIFYKENCFTFCTCNQLHDYNAARDISAAHAAYCFFKDRSAQALRQIKNIELHTMN